MNSLKNCWQKLRSLKHIHVYIAILIAVILCVCYVGFLDVDKKEKVSTEIEEPALEYVRNLENKLANVLSKISGVGKVSVMITLESGFGYEYATNEETQTTSSGDSITTKSVIMVSNEPVVEKEIYPIIKGVVIVATGAENFSVKMNILTATSTVLEIETSDITILS